MPCALLREGVVSFTTYLGALQKQIPISLNKLSYSHHCYKLSSSSSMVSSTSPTPNERQPSSNTNNNHVVLEILKTTPASEVDDSQFDYTQRGQWLRAASLGANDGLVSVASLMMGVGAVKQDVKVMLLAGFAGLVAGACSMAIGEFVSVYTQLDVERAGRVKRAAEGGRDGDDKEEQLPSPVQAAVASALAFSVGAMVPLLAAVFIKDYKVRLAVVSLVVTLALAVFGAVGAVLGKSSVVKSCSRVVTGGWLAMAITFGLQRTVEKKENELSSFKNSI